MNQRSMPTRLPPNPTPERERVIRELVRDGDCEYAWSTITSSYKEHSAEFSVFSDALKIDSIRINVTAETAQILADTLGCLLLTPKLADLIWLQRDVTLPPFPQDPTDEMSSTQAMVNHSESIDRALGELPSNSGLLSTVGKHWVIDNGLVGKPAGTAMNYGWHFEGSIFREEAFDTTASLIKDERGQLVRLIQGRGTRHSKIHVDYSQTCTLVHQTCKVDGVEMNLVDVLKNPELAPLANHSGVLKVLRQV